MLLLCLTGLPLIFHHEINQLTGAEIVPPTLTAAPSTARPGLDRVLAAARARCPGCVVQFVSQDNDVADLWFVTLATAPTDEVRSIAVDARTAEVLGEPARGGLMELLFRLHVDMFAGLPGQLFLGLMGLLLVVAIVSGTVLYAPFMRRLGFGEVRRERAPRVKWLDLHNLLGIVTLVWALVVGVTGVINTWADLLVKYWQVDQLSALLAPYQGQPTVPEDERAPVQRAFDAARAAVPGQRLQFIAFPGTVYSSPHHLSFFLRGDAPLTARLLQPVLVDARSARVTAVPALPWYLTAMLVSQPLHFGDYAGLPMKLLWAALDLATIVVLGSGLYLWLKRRQPRAIGADLPGAIV